MPPEATASATAAVAEILRLRAPLSLPVLRAALRGKKVLLSEAELLSVLGSGGFVEGPPGHWRPAPAERFTRERLASRCGVTAAVLDEVVGALASDASDASDASGGSGVDWPALGARLRAGAEVAVSAPTLGLLDEGVRRHAAVSPAPGPGEPENPADRRRRQLAEDEVAMLRAELDDERRRAELAQAERDRLREQATSVTVRSQPEAPAWHETEVGGFVFDLGAPETFGEERLRQALGQLESAVVLLDVTVGAVSIDAVVVHPGGVAVVEQYDLPATAAVVSVPSSGRAHVGGHDLTEDPRSEVMAAVRALQKRAALDLAYLPVVAFQGPADASAEDVLACLTSELDLAVDDALLDRPDQQPVTGEQVVALLAKLGVPELPRVPDGF